MKNQQNPTSMIVLFGGLAFLAPMMITMPLVGVLYYLTGFKADPIKALLLLFVVCTALALCAAIGQRRTRIASLPGQEDVLLYVHHLNVRRAWLLDYLPDLVMVMELMDGGFACLSTNDMPPHDEFPREWISVAVLPGPEIITSLLASGRHLNAQVLSYTADPGAGNLPFDQIVEPPCYKEQFVLFRNANDMAMGLPAFFHV